MREPIQYFVLGLGSGAVYALIALGMVLIFRGSGILNFAQGAMALVGASAYVEFSDNMPKYLAIILSVGISMVLGVLVNRIVVSPLRNASAITRLIATLALMTSLQQAAYLRYGPESRFLDSNLPMGTLTIGGVSLAYDRLVLIGISLVITAVLWIVYRYTKFGLVTSASAENEDAAALLGHSTSRVASVNWAVGSGLAGLAGVLIVPITGFIPTALTLLVIPAVSAAFLGGFASFPLTLAGALGIGAAQSELVRYVATPGWAQTAPFVVVILVLVVRGRGLPLRSFLRERLPVVGSGVVRPRAVGIAFVIMFGSLYLFSSSWSDAMTTTATTGIIVLSIVVLTGYCGQLSLAQYALAGIGALVSSRLADAWNVPFPAAVLLGVLCSIPIGLLVGLPAVRARGVSLAIATLGLSLVIEKMVLANPSYTGGPTVGTVVPSPSLLGLDIGSVAHPERYAAFCLIAFCLCALVIANLRRGRVGRRLVAVRSNERAAASLGISVAGAKLFAFGFAAAVAGLAGVLMAFRHEHATFDEYNVLASVEVILFATLGGIGFIGGAIIGGLAAPSSLGGLVIEHLVNVDRYVLLVFGLLVLGAVVVHPDGIAHDISRLIKRGSRRRGAASTVDSVNDDPNAAPARPVRVSPATLEVTNLTVRFGGIVALDDVTLTIRPGEVVGLIGPNGAGKTTFIDAVTGFVSCRGAVRLSGTAINDWSPHRRARTGVTRSFQSLELFDDLTVMDNLRVAVEDRSRAAYLRDMISPARTSLTPTALAAVREFGLDRHLHERPDQLPYGVRRLVAIARAVASSPSVLLLDEPAAGLDITETVELGHLIRRLADEWGIAVLLVEHDVSLVMSVSDRVVALQFGRLIAEGTPEEVRNSDEVITAYLGERDSEKSHEMEVMEDQLLP